MNVTRTTARGLAILVLFSGIARADDVSRLWMSSPYLDHSKHKAIVGVLRDAGYAVRDYTPQEVDRTAPPVVFMVSGDGRLYQVRMRGIPKEPATLKGGDGLFRRNGVVNGYAYRAAATGSDSTRVFNDLRRRYSYDMDIQTERDGTIVSLPKIAGFTLVDLHTFVSAPQNDESAVLNHLFRSVLTAAEKQRMGPTTIHYDGRTGRIWFRVAP